MSSLVKNADRRVTENQGGRMKIDVWTHFLSPAYVRHLEAEAAGGHKVASFLLVNRALHNLDRRFEVMDRFDARKILRIDAAQ